MLTYTFDAEFNISLGSIKFSGVLQGLGGMGNSPEMMSQIMNSPVMQNMMNDPELLRNMLSANPMVSQVLISSKSSLKFTPALPY